MMLNVGYFRGDFLEVPTLTFNFNQYKIKY